MKTAFFLRFAPKKPQPIHKLLDMVVVIILFFPPPTKYTSYETETER